MTAVPLSILDLAPIPTGGTAGGALRDTVELARNAEQWGYRRFWLAEHHLVPGVASSSPAVLIAAVAAATRHIRVGSGAVLLGQHSPLQVAEDFGTLAQLHPDRIDLGLGRSGLAKYVEFAKAATGDSAPVTAPEPAYVDGLPVPRTARGGSLSKARVEQLEGHALLLGDTGRSDYADQVREVLAFLDGTFRDGGGREAHAITAEHAALQVWVLGASAGPSSRAAGELGLPFVSNYHVTPSTVLDSAASYRDSFAPSPRLDRPHLVVSADVLVAEDDATARELATPFAGWVHDIRHGDGAQPYPSPDEARRRHWTEAERARVADRVQTRIVGSPETVVERLEVLRRVTGADELLITTITHDPKDRLRSYELLAGAWSRS
ncbi:MULTISPECIES: MsnO8 family LLM class oxidoreductase [unclassified Saccharopolyspora]|uniref:MsnO8 family LLM class oxidoreductase n=1 Tax=unclassified Saccharopolyspora TaxID=2646250 RepID=UPI001CD61E6A|nr:MULTISPECIES: MsnO8 family LLM class oxidoreductase [unclassified Saccharopolyspora]MCA1185381.1 MsnO8 family LLM class oxidoreductase [Saccharopolyspora sp. 6T]MCA1194209.1 MsnO8 family LLM class oxidoreductase [Saccharopolyspora sp. 6V]MCA1224719.1 MsnO8 family LLM class oxidoreductase [Saccharopolyspora sp. 6M]MCA1279354.1 MsnO8 family LLM class oxidoreductase [Saccharopolyspora sp. 7B]